MSPAGALVRAALRHAIRRVRVRGAIAAALTVAALVPVVLIAGFAVGDGWSVRGPGPLALVVAAVVAAVGLGAALVARWIRPVTDAAVAAAAERDRSLAEGSLRGVIELGGGLPPGTSLALFHRTERELSERLLDATTDQLAGELGRRARSRWRALAAGLAVLVLLAGAAGFAAPDRARAGWTPLLHPIDHLRGPTLGPLSVRPGDVSVSRGESVGIEVDAPHRSQVTLEWRRAGDVPGSATLEVTDGRAAGTIGPVTGPVRYRVRAPDGAASRSYEIRPIDPLLLSGLSVEVEYPPHVGREPERLEGEPPRLDVPDGTVLRLRGSATRSLASATLRRPDGAERVGSATGPTFRLDWRVGMASGGRWELELREDGGGETVAGAVLDLVVTPDAPPRVRVRVPGADTTLGPSLRQPVVADATDDYGIAAAELVYRRLGATGERGPLVRAPIPVDAGADRMILQAVLDASGQPLVPGDAIEYHIAVRDNSPAGQVGRSGTYLLRLPSRAQLRDRARAETSRLVDEASGLAEQSRELERATRNLSRRAASQGRTGQGGGSPGSESEPESTRLGFDQATEARQLADAHDAAMAGIEELRRRLAELRRAVQEAGLEDAEVRRQLEEIRALYEDLASTPARREVEALREAIDTLDPVAMQQALERLAERQEEIRQLIEESLAGMERAALEQEMNALARTAEEIAAEQRALASAFGAEEKAGSEERAGADDAAGAEESAGPEAAAGSEALADRQDELRERAEQLGESLQSLQQQLMQMGDSESASQAGAAQERGEAAQQAMQEAADQARQQQGEEAGQSGQRAAGAMADAARALDEARERMAGSRQERAQEAMQQGAQDALRLAEREESLRRQMEEMQQGSRTGGERGEALQQLQSEQAAVRQGLEQLGQNLLEAGRDAGMIEREVAQALARAMLNMDQTLEGLRSGGAMPVQQANRTVESLNQLALSLLETEARMRDARSGANQELFRQLGESAREQGQLNAQVSALAPLDLSPRSLSQQLEQAAAEQQAIARRVGELSGMLGGREDALGRLDPISSEAAEIARELRGGRLTPEVLARQDRLFHRLLDAGRTLEREEYSDERVGELAARQGGRSPDSLDPALLDSGLRYPVPSAAELRGLPPAYRRLILEYFDRLNHGATPSTSRPESDR